MLKTKMSRTAIITSTRNWLANRGRVRPLVLAGAVAGVLACEEPKEIGLPPTTPVGVFYTDTLTITRETIRFDSVRSNDQSNLMVGRYTDPALGRVQARAYVELSQITDTRIQGDFVVADSGTTNVTPANRIILDSTRLFLNYGQFFYGDTTQTQELQVYRLTDSLRRNVNYDISSSVPTESQPLARLAIRPRPYTTDSLQFRLPLPNGVGQELLTLANTDAGKVANSALFRAKVGRGLLLTTGANERAAVVGFTTGSVVVLYYHVAGETRARVYAFELRGKRFNQITADRSGTALASLQKGQMLTASSTNGRTFVQPATGVTTKLTFPTLTRLAQSGRVAINRADLVITPTNPNDATLPYPPLMVLAEVDEQNRLRRVPTSGFPFFVPSVGPTDRLAGSFVNPQEVRLAGRTNSYTFELGGYFQSIIAKLSPNTGLVLMTPGSNLFPTSQSGRSDATQLYLTDRVWRLVLDGDASVRLVVFYTTSQ